MGSKKYPGENEFETYLSKNGGYSNAYTELEYTCYYFECTVTGFQKAVDMFSGFFTDPLMNPDSSERELEAVESEYRFNAIFQSNNPVLSLVIRAFSAIQINSRYRLSTINSLTL
mmetsp:Transcript_10125/g.8464  ORF Transcript_10125/g.8464 Transcript_10125/m.8464 type:complete len:115 (-) Transcript_10125:279-623(-)